MRCVKTAELFDHSRSLTGEYLKNTTYPHEALGEIGDWILAIGAGLDAEKFEHPAPDVWIAKSASVAPTASTDTLGCAHNVRGVNRLIGGDENESLTSVHHSCIRSFVRTNGIVFDGFAGAIFHKRDVFMRRCVIYHVGLEFRENLIESSAISYRADKNFEVETWVLISKLKTDFVGIIRGRC